MHGQLKFGYRRPRTGEARRIRQHLRIDGLAPEVRQGIVTARAEGKTWQETAAIASALAGEHVGPTICHRWYDLRVSQPRKEEQAEQAGAIGAAFAAKVEPGALLRDLLELLARTRPEFFLRLSASVDPPEGQR